MNQNFGDQGYRARLSCHWDKNIKSPFRGGIRERTSFHRTKRSGQQKKHRKNSKHDGFRNIFFCIRHRSTRSRVNRWYNKKQKAIVKENP